MLGNYSQVLDYLLNSFNTHNEDDLAKALVTFGQKFAMDLLTSSKLTVNNENQVATVIMKMIEADKSYTGTLECIYREWLSENKLKELYEFVTKEKLYTKLLHFYRALEAMKNSRPIYFKAQYLRNVVIHKIKYNESIVNVIL